MTVDGKKVHISIVDLQDTKDGMETEVQHLYDSDDIYDEMNYLIKLKKNDNCDGLLNIEYKCGVPDDIDDSADTNDDTADTTADATADATSETTAAATADATTDAATATTDSQEGFTNNIDNRCILLVLILFTLWIYRKKILKILK